MKYYFILMAIVFGMIVPSASAQSVRSKVAVYVTGDADSGYKKVIGSKLVTGITRSENYSAVERTADFLAELAKEHDYQTSGAVSDNQIAKLGVQFGVRYVLVADVSEVFETMFVSARMIDVQTGLIKGSAEGRLLSESVDGLTDLSNALVYTLTMPEDGVKIIGPFNTAVELYYYEKSIPKGYKVASDQDIKNIIKTNKMLGEGELSYPIYYGINLFGENHFDLDIQGNIHLIEMDADGSVINKSFSYKIKDGSMSWNNTTSGGYIYLVKSN